MSGWESRPIRNCSAGKFRIVRFGQEIRKEVSMDSNDELRPFSHANRILVEQHALYTAEPLALVVYASVAGP